VKLSQAKGRRTLCAALAVSTLLVAACSSDDEGAESTSPATSPGTASTAPDSTTGSTTGSTTDSTGSTGSTSPDTTGTTTGAANPDLSTIDIGVVVEITGPQSSAGVGVQTVAPAWEKWVNTEMGGIGGHPVKLHMVDDKGDPATGASVVKDLVEKTKVIALVGNESNVNSAYSDYLLDKRVPVVGGTAHYPPSWENPMFFPLIAGGITVNATVGGIAKALGGTKAGMVYCAEVAQCQALEDLIKPGLERENIPYVGGVPAAFNAPNYTAECLKLRDEGADVIYVAVNAAVHERFVADCARQQYEPHYLASPGAQQEAVLEKTGDTAFYMSAFPWWADHPEAETFREVMDKYAKDKAWESFSGTNAWISFEFFRRAVLPTPGDAPTSEDVLAGLYALKDEDLNGMMANKVTFKEGEPVNPGWPCVFIGEFKDGKPVPNDMSKTVCGKT